MSSARHTPRYVPLIEAEPVKGPQLVGAEPAPRHHGPQPLGRRHSADIIPLHPLPPRSVVEAVPTPLPAGGTRRKARPVAKRPWKILVMSASASAPTRSFDLARWQARVVVAGVTITLLLSGAFVAAVVAAVRQPELVLIGDEATEIRARLAATADSLEAARQEIALREEADAVADSLSKAMVISSVPTLRSPLAKLGRRVNFSARLRGETPTVMRETGSSAGMGLPVVGTLASPFSRARRHPLLHIMRPHLGMDLAAPKGTPVTAPAPGVVTHVARSFTAGLVVEIQHANGVQSRYLHLSAASVSVGQRVLRGMRIGAVGSSGLSTGPHLHYEVLVGGHPVNPLHYRYAANEAAAAAAADAARALAAHAAAPAAAGAAPMDGVGSQDE